MTDETQSGAAVSSAAPDAGGGGASTGWIQAPPPADPLQWLRDADPALPMPLDAIACAATLAVMHHKCDHAKEAARMLKAYGTEHNLRTAQKSGARP